MQPRQIRDMLRRAIHNGEKQRIVDDGWPEGHIISDEEYYDHAIGDPMYRQDLKLTFVTSFTSALNSPGLDTAYVKLARENMVRDVYNVLYAEIEHDIHAALSATLHGSRDEAIEVLQSLLKGLKD